MGMSFMAPRLQSFQYYCEALEPNTGPVEVYTCKHLPMAYIMKIKHHDCDQRLIDIFDSLAQTESVNLISMYGCEEDDNCRCNTIAGEKRVSYWEYNVFYLDEFVQRRALRGNRLAEEEVWHVVKVALQGYRELRAKSLYYDFEPSKVIITPEGKAKLFWSHVKPRNCHLNYFRELEGLGKETGALFSPEEMKELKSG